MKKVTENNRNYRSIYFGSLLLNESEAKLGKNLNKIICMLLREYLKSGNYQIDKLNKQILEHEIILNHLVQKKKELISSEVKFKKNVKRSEEL